MKKTVSTSAGQDPVVVGELHLRLEVGHRAQAADHEPGADPMAEVDGQAVERLDVDPVGQLRAGLGQRRPDDLDPIGRSQQRRLARVLEDGDHDPVEDGDGPAQDVEVAVGDRIEGAGVDREAHPPSRR